MKTFSLVTHKLDSNVVETVEVVEKLKITKKIFRKNFKIRCSNSQSSDSRNRM